MKFMKIIFTYLWRHGYSFSYGRGTEFITLISMMSSVDWNFFWNNEFRLPFTSQNWNEISRESCREFDMIIPDAISIDGNNQRKMVWYDPVSQYFIFDFKLEFIKQYTRHQWEQVCKMMRHQSKLMRIFIKRIIKQYDEIFSKSNVRIKRK